MVKMKAKAESGFDTLLEMHTFARPAYSATEQAFCARYLDNLPGMQIDKAGNRILRIGTAPVLWSCHTDTVHRKEGMQRITYGDGIVSLAPNSDSSCLGADDSAGVWVAREMVLAGVSGLYIFHAGEEVGGDGSAYIAGKTPKVLSGIQYAIALDRKGDSSVITHQGGRCASDKFAAELARRLGGNFAPDSGGLFTDTANYTHLVPECTNLSIGYEKAHSVNEFLRTGVAVSLLETLKTLDVGSLPVARDCREDEFAWGGSGEVSSSGESLESLVKRYPIAASMLLEEMGYDAAAFERYLDSTMEDVEDWLF